MIRPYAPTHGTLRTSDVANRTKQCPELPARVTVQDTGAHGIEPRSAKAPKPANFMENLSGRQASDRNLARTMWRHIAIPICTGTAAPDFLRSRRSRALGYERKRAATDIETSNRSLESQTDSVTRRTPMPIRDDRLEIATISPAARTTRSPRPAHLPVQLPLPPAQEFRRRAPDVCVYPGDMPNRSRMESIDRR